MLEWSETLKHDSNSDTARLRTEEHVEHVRVSLRY